VAPLGEVAGDDERFCAAPARLFGHPGGRREVVHEASVEACLRVDP